MVKAKSTSWSRSETIAPGWPFTWRDSIVTPTGSSKGQIEASARATLPAPKRPRVSAGAWPPPSAASSTSAARSLRSPSTSPGRAGVVAQPGLLHGVLGLADAAQDAVSDREQQRPQPLELPGSRHAHSCLKPWRHEGYRGSQPRRRDPRTRAMNTRTTITSLTPPTFTVIPKTRQPRPSVTWTTSGARRDAAPGPPEHGTATTCNTPPALSCAQALGHPGRRRHRTSPHPTTHDPASAAAHPVHGGMQVRAVQAHVRVLMADAALLLPGLREIT